MADAGGLLAGGANHLDLAGVQSALGLDDAALLTGLAGCLLSLGSVTLFIQNISSARGYVALAANNLCKGHPLGALLSSALFGFAKALAQVMQNTAIKQQLLELEQKWKLHGEI